MGGWPTPSTGLRPPSDGGVGSDGGERCGDGESVDESEAAPRERIAVNAEAAEGAKEDGWER